MNQGTKQRIVGTVVLLALALIFLPIIFDGQGSYQAPLASRIPQPPAISILPDPTPVRPAPTVETPTPQVETAVSEPEPESRPAPADAEVASVVTSTPAFSREIPSLDANGLPQGWSVRLGTFADGNNASALVQRLQAAGYRAYTRRVAGSGAGMTGVYVGPWLDRDMVADYQKQLQEEFQLSGLVVRFDVEQLPD